jgi:hypothetical protein
MKTNWRELRDYIVSTQEAFGPFDPFSFDSDDHKNSHSDNAVSVVKSAESVKSLQNASSPSDQTKAKSVKSAESVFGDTERDAIQLEAADAELSHRLESTGIISIAIDRRTADCFLLTNRSDISAVLDVADVFSPDAIYRIHLTRTQQQQLLSSLDYYDRMQRRRDANENSR